MQPFVASLMARLQQPLLWAVLWCGVTAGCQSQEAVKPDPEALKKEAQEQERMYERESQNK